MMVSHNCRDPSSTQVFEGLIAGAVPVYRGTRGVHRFLPSNDSYIDANNISAKDLAAMLQNIGRSECIINISRLKRSRYPRVSSASRRWATAIQMSCVDYATTRSRRRERGVSTVPKKCDWTSIGIYHCSSSYPYLFVIYSIDIYLRNRN